MTNDGGARLLQQMAKAEEMMFRYRQRIEELARQAGAALVAMAKTRYAR